MSFDKLIKLYLDKVPNSSLSKVLLEQDLARLTDFGWSSESIFFSINYASKYYPSELEEGLQYCLDNNRTEMLKYYKLAKTKLDLKVEKEREEKYDSRNTIERANTPSWFRKSIDFSLFE